ncbi:hypothetical protein RJ55_02014 [Drechmeria coniospora]|nr:hypothetical protein RJ55_02014 [Drechmeria coniospora]
MRLLLALISLLSVAVAQFGFFDQMFNAGQQQQQQQQQGGGNSPSDANRYRLQYQGSVCDKYLCPDTLACVHFPHHCPCAWDANEEKFELAEGRRICVSRVGSQSSSTARKLELARKGLI